MLPPDPLLSGVCQLRVRVMTVEQSFEEPVEEPVRKKR
jgi:hypothetical protein